MPLIQSPTKEAWKSNLKAELGAGKPQKQALAIAFETQRRAREGKRKKKPIPERYEPGGRKEG